MSGIANGNISALEREKWERMRQLYLQNEAIRSEARRRGLKIPELEGTAAALARVFGPGGSPDNAWWTNWRPPDE